MFSPTVLKAQGWEEKTEFPGNPRHHPITWSIGNYGYVMGGSTGDAVNNIVNKDFYRYDASDDSWEQLTDFPGTPRSFSISAVYDGKAYIGFGMEVIGTTGVVLDDLWSYDPVTENWEELTSCPCEGRRHPTFTINEQYGKLYVGKGDNLQSNLGDWWEYDIANDQWTEKTTFPGSNRHHPFHFSIGEYSYSGLGHDNSTAMARSDLYRYNPVNDTWTQMTDAPGGRIAGTQFAYNGYGYVLSGDGMHHTPTNPSVFWRYDPIEDEWMDLPPHPGVSRWAPGSFVINGVAYFIAGKEGGQAGQLKKDLWAFDLDAPLALNDFDKMTLQIFPNPATDYLYISNEPFKDNMIIQVYDIRGKRLLEKPLEQRTDVSALSPGVYVVQLQNDSGILLHSRFIKK